MKNYEEFIENEKQKLAIKPEATKKAWTNQMHDTFVGLCVSGVEYIENEFRDEFRWIADVTDEHEYVMLTEAFLFAIDFLADNDIFGPESETMYQVTMNFYNIIQCVDYERVRLEEEEE